MLKKIAPQNLSQLCKLQKNFKHELVVLWLVSRDLLGFFFSSFSKISNVLIIMAESQRWHYRPRWSSLRFQRRGSWWKWERIPRESGGGGFLPLFWKNVLRVTRWARQFQFWGCVKEVFLWVSDHGIVRTGDGGSWRIKNWRVCGYFRGTGAVDARSGCQGSEAGSTWQKWIVQALLANMILVIRNTPSTSQILW